MFFFCREFINKYPKMLGTCQSFSFVSSFSKKISRKRLQSNTFISFKIIKNWTFLDKWSNLWSYHYYSMQFVNICDVFQTKKIQILVLKMRSKRSTQSCVQVRYCVGIFGLVQKHWQDLNQWKIFQKQKNCITES